MDWGQVFRPDTPLLELVVRGSLMYLAIFFLLRLVLKRQSGTIGMADLVVVVLIAEAAQNALADGYRSVTDGVVLVATILFWSLALDWVSHRVPAVERVVHPPPLRLVEDGRLLRRNMRRELITENELLTQVRLQGLESVEDVESAYMEGDGGISVIPKRDRNSRRTRGRFGPSRASRTV